MSVYAISTLITACTVALLASFVFLKNPSSRTNQTYSLYGLSIFVWVFGAFLMYLSKNKDIAIYASRIFFSGVIFIALTGYHFSAVVVNSRFDRKIIPYFYILSLFFLFICVYTGMFVTDMYCYYWGYYPKVTIWSCITGGLYYVFSLRSIYILYANLKVVDRTDIFQYNRVKYVLFAMIVSTISGIDYVACFGVSLYPIAHILTLVMLSIIAYAIVRHQLMDIEVIIKKTLVFAGLFASAFAVLVLPTVIIQEFVSANLSVGARIFTTSVSAALIVLILRPLHDFLIKITDKFLFQKKYDYKELLKTFTTEVLTVLDLTSLVKLTTAKLSSIMKIESCGVLLFNEAKEEYQLVASYGIADRGVVLSKDNTLTTFLDRTRAYLSTKHQGEDSPLPKRIVENMNKLKLQIAVPLVVHDDMIGILTLGKKKSDEEYTQDDIDILLPLARTLAIAISNATVLEELSKTQAEAAQREKMAVIGTLSAGINHEICNPLGIARGQCEAFLLNLRDGLYKNKTEKELLEKAQTIMEKVIHETDRATAITKRLSSFAKPSKGEISDSINIQNEVDEVLALVGYEMKLDRIEILNNVPKDAPKISGDKKQIQEVLFNLVRNAAQAILEKGKITVTTRHDTDRLFIDIQDTGQGIPEDKVQQIFNPFYTTKEPGKGTGLGLFIVKQVVEKNDGKISLKSKVGEGTMFTLEFPITEKAKV